ncbi:SLATT domain-containing protein [Pseudomonas pseudonitroreducens]|uniref:SLATT domain-containing protein n=1 Tax=Pseudomonas pseudonitroreducens TaxID=2892326 RepID=UPI001F1D5D05|nr:DUF4231 domain-containing protein [Pseudomonas pseudonitroreducens]
MAVKSKDFYESEEAFCENLINGFKEKAGHNETEAMVWFAITMGGSLVAPLFVTLGGDDFVLSKIIPSIISTIVAFGTAWLQLRKPQHLWALYRGCQRKLEDNLARYRFKIEEYSQEGAEKYLARKCAEIAMEAHNEWLPMVPRGESLSKKGSGSEDN